TPPTTPPRPPRPPRSPLFPYTTLFRSAVGEDGFHPDHHVLDLPVSRAVLAGSSAGDPSTHGRQLVALREVPDAEAVLLAAQPRRSEEHTSELQSRFDLVCRLLLEQKKR